MNTCKFLIICNLFAIFLLGSSLTIQGQSKNKDTDKGYAKASYSTLSDNEFMKDWLILGPVKVGENGINPDDKTQEEVFKNDLLTRVEVKSNKPIPNVTIGDTSFAWKFESFNDGIVDFNRMFGGLDYCYAYALAEIKMDSPTKVLVGVGSDDGIKIFLNGKMVHSNWIGRGFVPDQDLLILDLQKGSNQILIKVQDMQYDWSFGIRKPGKDKLGDLLIEYAANGNLDNIKLLLENQVDINFVNDLGLSAYQSAMINGREKIMEFLKQKGAKTDLTLPPFDGLVNRIFKSAQNGITPGVSILVSQDGKIVYQNCFGYADVGNKVKVTPDTKFRIGSISKQFIASSILKLQEQGKLNVTDKLSKYIKDFPRGDEVTLYHLLTHTSGIHSYTNRPDFIKYVNMPVTPDALVDTIMKYPYDFSPGERYSYNNSGFYILGYILEKISGKSLANYLDETIFKSLGMNNTGVYESQKLLDNEAYGYVYVNDTVYKALNWDMSWAGGAGALYSTVKDLYKWNEAVFNGKFLSEESMKAAFTSAELNNKQKIDYGYGWGLYSYRGLKFISHGGGLHGFLSNIERQPETKTTAIVLCNSTPPPAGINPGTNTMQIITYLLWDKMEKQASISSDIKIDPEILQKYVGKYDYGQAGILTVTIDNDQLYAQLAGQPRYPIFPSSEEEFHWKIVEASVRFFSDEEGKVTHLIHNQGGQQIEAKKIE